MTPVREKHFVTTTTGQSVEVLVRDDLDDLKDTLLSQLSRLTRWLIGVGLAAAFAVGFWAASLRAELNSHAEAIAGLSVHGSTPVQEIREDLAATREKITALQADMQRLERTLERRP